MSKREQLFLFWMLALISVGGLLYWFVTELRSRDVVIEGVQVGQVMGGLFVWGAAFFLLLLAVATILMPLFVVAIHTRLKMIHKEMEKQTFYLQKLNQAKE